MSLLDNRSQITVRPPCNMTKQSPAQVPVNESSNLQAIRYRLNKAFPETGRFFRKLTEALTLGAPWHAAVSAYAVALPAHRLERLSLELTDLFSMGWTDSQQFDLVMRSIFGLDVAVARRSADTTW